MADYNPSMVGRGRNLDADLGLGATNTGKTYSGGSSVVIGGFDNDDNDDKAPGLFTPKPKPVEDKEPSFWEKVTSAFTNSGYTPTSYTGVTAEPMSLYDDPDYGEAQDYMQRKSVEAAVEEASTYDQQAVNTAIRSVNDAAIAGKTDAEIAEVFLNDMGGFGSDKPDETGGMGVPGTTLVDVTDTQQGLMTNPKPLYDFAEEMRSPSITTTELPSISQEDKDKLGAKLRKAAEDGSLSSVMNQLAQDSTVLLSSAADSFVGGETEVAANTQDWRRVLFPEDYADEEPTEVTVDPETGQQIQDSVPAQSQGLMSRNVYSPEGPESVQDFSDIKTAQLALAGLGYDIGRGGKKNLKNLKIVDKAETKPSEVRGADGIMGGNTKAAIKAFQEDNGLEVTGELDSATVEALGTTPEPTFKYDAGYFNTDKQNDNMTAMYKAAVDAGIEGLELVALMSQAAHESDKFKTAEEYASGNAYEGRTDLGNVQEGDGKRYKGRGYLQITGRTNYKDMGDKLGVDLVNNPEKLEDRNLAAKASVEWWKENVQPLVADFSDVERVTKIVNGGFNGLADRKKYFEEFLDR